LNRSQSKYFSTAEKMDEAFLSILEKKDLAYITVKEICAAAGVNRSTFYLHYETVADLLSESVEYMNRHFLEYMNKDSGAFIAKLRTCPLDELYLLTPEYLTPYLNYIRENQRLLRTVLDNAAALRLEDSFTGLLRNVLIPILERYAVPEGERKYLIAFYLNGLMAIITEWLKGGCADSIECIITVMQKVCAVPQTNHTYFRQTD